MIERDLYRLMLLAYQSDDDVAKLTEAEYYGRATNEEVEEATARAHGNWLEVARHVAEREREAQKRLLVYLSRSAA